MAASTRGSSSSKLRFVTSIAAGLRCTSTTRDFSASSSDSYVDEHFLPLCVMSVPYLSSQESQLPLQAGRGFSRMKLCALCDDLHSFLSPDLPGMPAQHVCMECWDGSQEAEPQRAGNRWVFHSQTINGCFRSVPFDLKFPTRAAHPRTPAFQRRLFPCRRGCASHLDHSNCAKSQKQKQWRPGHTDRVADISSTLPRGVHHACWGQISSRVSVRTPKVCCKWAGDEMTRARLSVKASPKSMHFLLDTGNPLLNCTLEGVLKIGGVGAAHAATQEAYSWMRKGSCTAGIGTEHNRSSPQILQSSPVEHVPTTRRDIEKIVKKAGKEGLQWGIVAGMYAGFEYGMGKARGGKHDWKNAAVGGALTGAMLSVSDGRVSQDKMVRTALTASALATAAEFLKLL